MSWLTNKVRDHRYKIFVLLFFIVVLPRAGRAEEKIWQEQKGTHFIIYYTSFEDQGWASEVLNRAEDYYDSIGNQLGLARYDHFWTWEGRVKIFVFSDQEKYLKFTGLPQWSNAVAVRDKTFMEKKAIVTFKQEQGFLDGILPHEIAHFVLRDYIGFDKDIPLWFDEGIAQLQEANKGMKARLMMQGLAQSGHVIPVKELVEKDIRKEKDPQLVSIFYLESISILDFLIKQYGSNDFSRLCREFKNSKTFEGALEDSYGSTIDTLGVLEDKWLRFLKN